MEKEYILQIKSVHWRDLGSCKSKPLVLPGFHQSSTLCRKLFYFSDASVFILFSAWTVCCLHLVRCWWLSLRWTLSPQPPCQETAPYLVLTQWEPSFQQATNSHLQNLPAHPFCKHTKWVIGHTNAYLHCNLAFVYTAMDFFSSANVGDTSAKWMSSRRRGAFKNIYIFSETCWKFEDCQENRYVCEYILCFSPFRKFLMEYSS